MTDNQMEEIEALLSLPVEEVEDTRVYTSSSSTGTNIFHLIDKVSSGVQIEQIDINEKWGKRVNIQTDEIPALLHTLLLWYFEDVQAAKEEKARYARNDLDDHPF